MHRPHRFVRRTVLGMLATLPLGLAAERASAATPAESVAKLVRNRSRDSVGTIEAVADVQTCSLRHLIRGYALAGWATGRQIAPEWLPVQPGRVLSRAAQSKATPWPGRSEAIALPSRSSIGCRI